MKYSVIIFNTFAAMPRKKKKKKKDKKQYLSAKHFLLI